MKKAAETLGFKAEAAMRVKAVGMPADGAHASHCMAIVQACSAGTANFYIYKR